MSTAFGSKIQFTPGSISQQVFDVLIGIATGSYYTFNLIVKFVHEGLMNPTLRMVGFETTTKSHNTKPERKPTLKVAGVGYGRTGTLSLKLALDELGISTFHATDAHLYSHKYILDSWNNDIVMPSIESKKASLGKQNLDLLLDNGFEATVDFPNAWYYEQILSEYPDCKFILTTRESSEAWYKSWYSLSKSCTDVTNWGSYFFEEVGKQSAYLRWVFALVNNDNTFLTKPFPLPPQNKTAAIQSYEEHNQRVREIIPSQQLLEYDVKQGWEPLCKFLDITDCPTNSAFPKTHASASMDAQHYSAFVMPFVIILVTIYFTVKKIKSKMNQNNVNPKQMMKCQ